MSRWWLDNGYLRTTVPTGAAPLAIVVIPDVVEYLTYIEAGRRVWKAWR